MKAQIADDLRWISYVYVVERCRMMGFAHRMITTARDLGEPRTWTGIVGLDAFEHGTPMYMKLDYQPSIKKTFYQGTVSADVARQRFGTDIRLV